MNENTKIQILSNDTVRRLLTTKEDLGAEYKGAVIDQYGKKLLHSGFNMEQTRKILKNGIKGYIGKLKNRIRAGRKLRSTAQESLGSRNMKKLLSKTNWYRKKKKTDEEQNVKIRPRDGREPKSREQNKNIKEQAPEYKTVLFVEYTKNGELASQLRELTGRLAPTLGFRVKVVERAGASMKSQFPTSNLWDGQKCGRKDCVTCEQGAEMLPDCTSTSLVYENVCGTCNPGAGTDKELVEVKSDVPTMYVGETSRSIFERSKEHWGAWRSRDDASHIHKHQVEVHGGAENPKFYMRAVRNYRSALSRQIGEVVWIRRRGGSRLYSKQQGRIQQM